jgi:hypothetical protein
VWKAMLAVRRFDLIGEGCDCLISAQPRRAGHRQTSQE